MNPKLRLFMPLFTIVAALALAPTANATCYSSTPASGAWGDSPFDGDYGLAPEILGATASVDGACGVTVDAQLDAAFLIYGDASVIFLDLDGNPATGAVALGGLDKATVTTSAGGPYLATWNGYQFALAGAPLIARYSLAGFASSVDQLGIAAPANVGIQVGTIYSGVYDDYVDFLPEPGSPLLRVPVGFSTTPPAPPPVTTNDTTTEEDDSCRVPRVKGLTAKKARRKLGRAGCWYSLKGHGRVYSVKPSAGTRTSGKVRVKARRRARARASTAHNDAALAAARTALDQAVERLTKANKQAHDQ